jgi:hypothetical protein
MASDAPHGFAQQAESRRHSVPGRSAGWMGQWDDVELATIAVQRKRSANNFVELFKNKKLRDGQFTHRDDKLRLQEIDFIIYPGRAIPNFVRRRNAVSARGCFSRKTAADRGEIDLRAHFGFTQMAELLEPTKEGAASCPGERPAQNRLSHTRRLTDQNDLAENRSAGDGRRQHPRTTPALAQARDMPIQQSLLVRCQGHYSRSLVTDGRTTRSG